LVVTTYTIDLPQDSYLSKSKQGLNIGPTHSPGRREAAELSTEILDQFLEFIILPLVLLGRVASITITTTNSSTSAGGGTLSKKAHTLHQVVVKYSDIYNIKFNPSFHIKLLLLDSSKTSVESPSSREIVVADTLPYYIIFC
jgi:hypothetical protein